MDDAELIKQLKRLGQSYYALKYSPGEARLIEEIDQRNELCMAAAKRLQVLTALPDSSD